MYLSFKVLNPTGECYKALFVVVLWGELLLLLLYYPDRLEDLAPRVRVGLALGCIVAVIMFLTLVLSLSGIFLLSR